MQRTELEAILALLNDIGRSDIRSLGGELAAMSKPKAESLIEDATDPIQADNDISRLIAKEVSELDRLEYLETIEQYHENGVKCLLPWDEDYPTRLRAIDSPPLVLFVNGRRFPTNNPFAVVGTRDASEAGLQVGREFVKYLVNEGCSIVSGLAYGCDTVGHTVALENDADTVAVLAGHVDDIHPPSNKHLARNIVGNGAIVSEITSRTSVHKGRFVERNRITSGLSNGVLIIEARETGGTPHQAKFALGQDRPTYIIDQGDFEDRDARKGFEKLVDIGVEPVEEPSELASSL